MDPVPGVSHQGAGRRSRNTPLSDLYVSDPARGFDVVAFDAPIVSGL